MADNSLNYASAIAGKQLNPPNPATWEAESNANYTYAATFYQQRKMAFLHYIDKNIMKQGAEIIGDELNSIFEKVWSKGVIEALQQGIDGDYAGGQAALEQINKEYDLHLNYAKLFQTYTSKKANLGYDYEEVAAQLLSSYFYQLKAVSSNFIGNHRRLREFFIC